MIRWDWWYTATNEQIRQDKERRETTTTATLKGTEGKKGRKEGKADCACRLLCAWVGGRVGIVRRLGECVVRGEG